jgi:hypothetical protein
MEQRGAYVNSDLNGRALRNFFGYGQNREPLILTISAQAKAISPSMLCQLVLLDRFKPGQWTSSTQLM